MASGFTELLLQLSALKYLNAPKRVRNGRTVTDTVTIKEVLDKNGNIRQLKTAQRRITTRG